MIQNGLFAPNTLGGCNFLQLGTGDFTTMYVARSHIYSDFWRLSGGVSCTPPFRIKTESIPEPKVGGRNQSFLVNRNWNRNQLQFLERNRNRI